MEQPASKGIYDEAIEQMENWTKILTFLLKKVVPLCGVLSRAIPSFFFYFVTDMGCEAFGLPVPMW